MSSLTNIVTDTFCDAVGIETSTNTSLKDFLSKFSDSSGKYANLLNPLNTFEVNFKFYPTNDSTENESHWYTALNGAAKNAVNNITGGLLGSLRNDSNSVKSAHNSNSDVGTYSFMHYLAEANLLASDENTWFGATGSSSKPLILQLGYYVQSITVPLMRIPDGGKSTTMVGEFPINGTYIATENNQLLMEILNTKLPLIERIFYPWMKEVTLPYWSYETLPYTTANITIDFNKHTDMKYVFYGCRPTLIAMMQPNQLNDLSFKRNVNFVFDFMTVQSDLTTMESLGTKLLNTVGTLINSAANTINF